MSTSERLQADYLTCSQCTKPFHQPKTLPCLHNFCKACLSAYLEQENSGGKSTTFKCPDCNEKIYVPDPSKPVTRWASQFPTNFILSGMVEAISDELEGEESEEKVKAAKERRGHLDDDHSPSRPPKEKDSSSKTNTADGLQERLVNVQDTVRSEGAEISNQLQAIRNNHQRQKKQLEMSFSRILGLIESRKVQLVEELEQNFEEEKQRISQAKQTFQNDLDSLKSCGECLDGMGRKSLTKKVKADLFEAVDEQISEIEMRPTKIVARSIRFEQKLEAGRSILNLIDNLGSVTITTAGEVHKQGSQTNGDGDDEIDIGGNAKMLAKPKFISQITAKKSPIKHEQIHAVTVMQSGAVIMMSSNVIQAAMNYESGYEIFGHLKLDTEAKSLVAISPHYVAVVGKFCLYLIGVTASKLILKQRVETGKSYNGIAAYSESSLIMTCNSPPSVDFVGLNGFISETIDKDLTTNSILFRNPQFITTSHEGVIFVIDFSSVPKLLSMNNAGKVLFKYPSDDASELKAPQGVACDSCGHIYVVDREAKAVSLITPSGDKVKDLLTEAHGLSDPCAIAIDKNDHIYVTNNFSEVLVFQVK